MYADHVGALNLIELEFADQSEVIKHWRNLLTHFGTTHPRSESETEQNSDEEKEKLRKTRIFHDRLFQERQELLTLLLHSMAKTLNFNIEQLEIFKGGYVPQGHIDMEDDGHVIRQFIADIARNNRLLPIGVFDYVSYVQNSQEKTVDQQKGTDSDDN